MSLAAGQARRRDARSHLGENIGATGSHVVVVELREGAGAPAAGPPGPIGAA